MKHNNHHAPVPPTAEERLAELAEILAAGLLRMAAKKSVYPAQNCLEDRAEKRLSVHASNEPRKGA